MAAGRSVCKSAGRHGSEGTLRRKGMEGGDGTRRQPRTGAQTGRGREHGEEGIYNRIEGIGTAEGTGRGQGGSLTEGDSEQGRGHARDRATSDAYMHSHARGRAASTCLHSFPPAGTCQAGRGSWGAQDSLSLSPPPPPHSPPLPLSLPPPLPPLPLPPLSRSRFPNPATLSLSLPLSSPPFLRRRSCAPRAGSPLAPSFRDNSGHVTTEL